MTCFVDRTTHEQLEKLRKQKYRGDIAPFTGTVVGSNMRRRLIDVNIKQFVLDITCTYRKKQETEFEPHTRLRTELEFTGRPVWEGTDEPDGIPHYIELARINKAVAAVRPQTASLWGSPIA